MPSIPHHLMARLAVCAAAGLVLAAGGPAPAGRDDQAASRPTRSYSLYVGFAAQMDCVPKEGPYLTRLSHDVHVPDLKFVFETRKLPGMMVNWHPLLGGGPAPSIPRLIFDTAGHIDAALCPHIECDGKIEKAWFTKRSEQFDALFQVVSDDEIPDIRGEIVNPGTTGELGTDLVALAPYVLHVHFIAANKFAWTGQCIVRHQDCGSTADLDFYLSLPASRLLKGEEVSIERPFQTDDIDAPGVLTIRFIPTGSIK